MMVSNDCMNEPAVVATGRPGSIEARIKRPGETNLELVELAGKTELNEWQHSLIQVAAQPTRAIGLRSKGRVPEVVLDTHSCSTLFP